MIRYAFKVIFLVTCLAACSCSRHCNPSREDFGILGSAVTFSSDKVIGEYGDTIPEDFTAERFKELMKGKIPPLYFEALEKYALTVTPKGTHYYLVVTCQEDNSVLLRDYSCTPEVDWPVYLEPEGYGRDKDPCE